jgi:hypothetical protein
VLDNLNVATGDMLHRTDVFTSTATMKETNAHLRAFAKQENSGNNRGGDKKGSSGREGNKHEDSASSNNPQVKGLTAMVSQVTAEFAK